jgi:hypothetical protein
MSDVTPNLAPDLVLERTIPVPPERIRAAWRGPPAGAADAVVHAGTVEDGHRRPGRAAHHPTCSRSHRLALVGRTTAAQALVAARRPNKVRFVRHGRRLLRRIFG